MSGGGEALRPLAGKRVLVTRARAQASELARLLEERGAAVVSMATIELYPPSDPLPMQRALARLADDYDCVAFTSANAVERAVAELERQARDASALASIKIAAIGPGTARALVSRGVRVDITGDEARGEGLARALLAALPEGARVLVPRAKDAREVLPDTLRAAGMRVDVVAVYETKKPSDESVARLVDILSGGGVDAVTLTSGSTVDHLCDLLGDRAAELLAPLVVASIGPVTTAAAEKRGVRVHATAGQATLPGLVDALEQAFRRPDV